MDQAVATVLPFLPVAASGATTRTLKTAPIAHTDLDLLYKTWWAITECPELIPVLDALIDNVMSD